MVDCVKQSIAANGPVRGPLQGFSATLLRNVPAAGVYFGTFEALKARPLLARAHACGASLLTQRVDAFSCGLPSRRLSCRR